MPLGVKRQASARWEPRAFSPTVDNELRRDLRRARLWLRAALAAFVANAEVEAGQRGPARRKSLTRVRRIRAQVPLAFIRGGQPRTSDARGGCANAHR